jgi:tRNA pseudouridine55 synthase
MEGILLVDKPAGWTSFDAVNYVRKQIADSSGLKPKQIKVGHSGTLDPFATGLLVILIGKSYTKRAATFSNLEKTYEAEMKLGFSSSSGDPEGKIKEIAGIKPTGLDVKHALVKFKGAITQIPPQHSAIKINGERAYKLARRGQQVNMPPRKVSIKTIELINYDYPLISFRADVSSGTYIRSLVEDIGLELSTNAYTTKLRRLSVGEYSVEEAIKLPSSILASQLLI